MNQRILKFRAWDYTTSTPKLITKDFHIIGEITVFNMLGQYQKGVKEYNNILVEQYTGLDDKKGNPIYEGDIVKADGFKPELYEIRFIESAFCGWYEKDCILIDITIWYTFIGCLIEVVGNIHERTEQE